ncbi:MAG: YhbY family RNA-binding protein [Clostridia bacterium]|nr:YhbY family RNA-binding protein [Clostridia bacterium]
MTSKDRAKLRSIASTEPAILQVGKGGINENLILQVENALKARELIKLSVLENSDYSPMDAAEELAEATGAVVVSTIGSKFVLYKKKEKDSKIGINV